MEKHWLQAKNADNIDPNRIWQATEEVRDMMFSKLDCLVRLFNSIWPSHNPYKCWKDVPAEAKYNMDEMRAETNKHIGKILISKSLIDRIFVHTPESDQMNRHIIVCVMVGRPFSLGFFSGKIHVDCSKSINKIGGQYTNKSVANWRNIYKDFCIVQSTISIVCLWKMNMVNDENEDGIAICCHPCHPHLFLWFLLYQKKLSHQMVGRLLFVVICAWYFLFFSILTNHFTALVELSSLHFLWSCYFHHDHKMYRRHCISSKYKRDSTCQNNQGQTKDKQNFHSAKNTKGILETASFVYRRIITTMTSWILLQQTSWAFMTLMTAI